MSIVFREKGVNVRNPHIVKRSTDGKYAIRYINKDGTKMYLELYGKFNSGRIDRIMMTSGRREWQSEEYQQRVISVDSSYSEWTNNLRALRKVLNYREDIIE